MDYNLSLPNVLDSVSRELLTGAELNCFHTSLDNASGFLARQDDNGPVAMVLQYTERDRNVVTIISLRVIEA